MKLLRLEIENFGKLSGFSIDLEDGVNILCEKNGWGKTTLAVFIKAMLYGLPATTKRGLDRNERKKYMPWQGGAYGGSMEFECDAGKFRVERFFGAKEALDEFRLFDLSTNKPSDAYSADLGIELFGIDADGFERSTYLSQRIIDLSDGAASITTKLTGLLDDVNDIGSYDVAMKAIDKQRQIYEVKGGRGRISDIKNELLSREEELNGCRELLPAQRDLEQKIAQTRERIKESESKLLQIREQKEAAQLRNARMEESARMQNRITQAEERRREILRAFKDQAIPSDEELAAVQAQLSDCRAAQVTLQAHRLTDEEAAQMQNLHKKYPNELPSPEFLSRVQQEIQSLTEAKSERKALGAISEGGELARFAHTGIPSQATLDQAVAALEKAEEAERSLSTGESKSPATPAPVSKLAFLPLSVGLCLTVLGAILSSLRIPFLILGILLVGIGGVWLLLSSRKKAQATQRLQAAQAQERDAAHALVRDVLKRYAYPSVSDAELRATLGDLILSARTARQEEAKIRSQRDTLDKVNERILRSQSRINDFFTRIGFSSPPQDPLTALVQIREDLSTLRRLQAKKQVYDAKVSELGDAFKENQASVGTFLSRLNATTEGGNRPEDRLHQIKDLCREHATLLGNIRTQRREREEFIRQHALLESVELPSEDALLRQSSELERSLRMLREDEASLRPRLDRMIEQTQRIPELEDDVKRLSGDLDAAKGSLQLLRRTADFLENSKEALSTRYLDGIQTHFARYRTILEGADASRAVMDTDFNVSVTESGKSRSIESFSRGKRDVLQFCARLALVKAMFDEGELPFLLLDDPFVNLDEDNLAAARELLSNLSNEFQILYFICHTGRL